MRGRVWPIAAVGVACVALSFPALAPGSISKHRLRRGLLHEMQQVGGASGAWVYDIDAASNRTLFSFAAHTRRVLASNSKLFTTAAVLDRFGPDGRLRTTLYTRPADALQGHVVHGSLVLVGDGDPALAKGSFARANGLPLTPLGSLAGSIRRAGITKVTGRIRADDGIFDRLRGIPSSGVVASPYLSPLSGLSYDSGFEDGRYAAAPELVAARALRTGLRHRGIRVKRGIGRADLSVDALRRAPLASVHSPSMEQLVDSTNKPSNNFFAEMLLKRLAARRTARGTTRRGARRVVRFADRLGTSVRMENGSGLSRRNRASPKQVGRLLVAMTRQPDADAYRGSLPLAGQEGTVAQRMNGTAADGRCRAKTGTLIGVSALSGYCNAGHGQVAFSFLMNGVDITAARRAQDEMAALIARYR